MDAADHLRKLPEASEASPDFLGTLSPNLNIMRNRSSRVKRPLVIVVGWRIVPNDDSIGFGVRRIYPIVGRNLGESRQFQAFFL